MKSSYKKLAVAISINAVLMFLITYVLIASFDHFYPNVNRFYMTVMMVAPMVLVMLWVMRHMYESQRLNVMISVAVTIVFLGTFALARTQTPIGDDQFLRSMIPHHSSAILMCEQASISDPRVLELCEEIVRAQEEEIAQMKAILADPAGS